MLNRKQRLQVFQFFLLMSLLSIPSLQAHADDTIADRGAENLNPISHTVPSICELLLSRKQANPGYQIKVIAGLGNAGSRYRYTRHNAGALAVDHLATAWGATGTQDGVAVPPENVRFLSFQKYEPGEIEETQYSTQREVFRTEWGEVLLVQKSKDVAVLLVRPFYFMNDSGEFIAMIYKALQMSPSDLIVLRDDFDTKVGSTKSPRLIPDRHNGTASIDEHLGVENQGYSRIRIGIGRPDKDSGIELKDYVTGAFTPDEMAQLKQSFVNLEKEAALLVQKTK